MRHILKEHEPASWTAYRKTPNATYQATADLRLALLKEQGYLCGYCMKRINHADEAITTTRIEHVKCQTVNGKEDTTRSLDYNNMILCCEGGTKAGKQHHQCDVLKGDRDLSFSPTDKRVLEVFTFSGLGIMKASNAAIQAEIGDPNNPGTLNLNNSTLIRNRKAVIDAIQCEFGKGIWDKTALRDKLEHWSEKDKDGMYKEYSQVVINYIAKKLK